MLLRRHRGFRTIVTGFTGLRENLEPKCPVVAKKARFSKIY